VRGAVVVVVVLALLIAALWLLQRRLIYLPDRTSPPAAAVVLPGAEDVAFDTSDGLRLRAWLVRPAGPGRSMAVLVAPGNGGNRLGRAPLARALAEVGFTVLLVEYRGYGGNPGGPSQPGLARDVRAAREYLATTLGLAPERILYFGESLGSAVVTELATQYPPAGLVLRSPFRDLGSVARHLYPIGPAVALLRDRYPVEEQIAGVTAPTVVIYGTADSLVPPEQSLAVAARAGARTVPIEGADHNDPALVDGPAVIGAVVELADRIGRT
jgi:pimeloyl-ACP methyl ester carboxylesterase